MTRTGLTSLYLLGLIAPSAALAQPANQADGDAARNDDIVVTASSDTEGVSRALLGGSVPLLSADDLEQRGTRILVDVLRDVPGIEVSRSGCAGCTTQVRLRGAEGNHTLVLVDGINLGSPVNRETDF